MICRCCLYHSCQASDPKARNSSSFESRRHERGNDGSCRGYQGAREEATKTQTDLTTFFSLHWWARESWRNKRGKLPGGASSSLSSAAGLCVPTQDSYVTMIVAGSLHGPAPTVLRARNRNQVSFPRARLSKRIDRELGNAKISLHGPFTGSVAHCPS